MQLSVKRLTKTAKIPTKAHPSDAGIDLYADLGNTGQNEIVIRPGETIKVPTGIAIQLPDLWHTGFETVASLIWDRSGLGSKGIHRVAGVIDHAYIGEIVVCLTNLNIYPIIDAFMDGKTYKETIETIDKYSYRINHGDKIAQIIIQKVLKVNIKEVDKLIETDRGDRGFGSTDNL